MVSFLCVTYSLLDMERQLVFPGKGQRFVTVVLWKLSEHNSQSSITTNGKSLRWDWDLFVWPMADRGSVLKACVKIIYFYNSYGVTRTAYFFIIIFLLEEE